MNSFWAVKFLMTRAHLLTYILITLLMPGVVLPGTTGKIAGKVRDKESGEPLVGANLMIVGTTLGASSDPNGEYFILQLPPGHYKVRASLLGYQAVLQENISVTSDLTATVDFTLSTKAIEGKEVVVVAERPMVQKDVTYSMHTVSSEEIARIPNVRNIQSVIRIQPGVVGSNVRGGRARETVYLVDGVPVANPVSGGYSGINIPPDAIAELTMITGGFSAEYGQAQSGVVNIVTKEGGERWSGGMLWRSDRLIKTNSQNSDYMSLSLSGPEPVTTSLGFDALGSLFVFASGDVDLTDTYVPSGGKRKTFYAFGIPLRGRYENRYSVNVKLSDHISPNHTLSLSYRKSENRSNPYDHFWKYLPDRMLTQTNEDIQWMLSWNHVLNPKTFYTFRFSQLSHRHNAGVDGMLPPNYPSQYAAVGDVNKDGFADAGSPQFWGQDGIDSWTGKADVSSQVHSRHLIQGGLEWVYYKMSETSISYPGWRYAGRDTIPGLWPEYGGIRTAYEVFPSSGALYAQDKMEFEGLIVNLGVRYDFWIAGKQVESRGYRNDWESRTGLKSEIEAVKGNLSPRIGISYPIAENTVMYFSYGRFTQLPSLLQVYRDAYVGQTAGNPYSLNSEVSSAYEAGFSHQFREDMLLELKGFLKDVSGLVGLSVVGHFGLPMVMYVNKDYGTTRGFELQLKKRYNNYTSGTISYTLAWAYGRSSDPNQEVSLLAAFAPPLRLRDYRLNWDQRHTLNVDFHIRSQKDDHIELFGFRLPDRWGIDFLWRFGSGFPYTPPTRGDLIQPPINAATGPWSSTVDMQIEKSFDLFGTNCGLFIEALNLFDRKNVNTAFLNPATGKPFKFGDTTVRTIDQPDFRIYNWEEMQTLLNPLRVGPGRQINVGFRVNW